MNRIGYVVAVLGLCGVLGAGAGALAVQQVTVTQKGRTFSTKDVTIGEGGTVLFVNDDGDLLHHVFARSPELSFDSGEMKSGAQYLARFPRKGSYQVRCEIHPRMVMNVTVE